MAEGMLEQPPARPSAGQLIRAHLALADPTTWIAAVAVVICGAMAAGRGDPGFQFGDQGDLWTLLLVALMCGPGCTGFSQSINDYFDRDLDAINDPGRPIPAGRISLGAARMNWIGLGLATLGLALILARESLWVPVIATLGLLLAAAYSVPPLRLKRSFWFGPPAVGIGYVCLCWLAGHMIFAPLTWPSLGLALINSGIATGLLFLNDIKSVEGDRQHGLRSITVALGARRTLTVAFLLIGGCELLVLALALANGHLWLAGATALALLVPIPWQLRLYRETTHRNFQYYMLVSNPFALLIQFLSAAIVGGYLGS